MSGPFILPVADHLLEEEVDFDLKLRGQEVDRRETLDDKRRFLRRLLLEEKKSKSGLIGRHQFCDDALRIEKTIKVIAQNLSKKFDLALISRLRHYYIRAQTAITNDDSERHNQATICGQIEEVLRGFNQKIFPEGNEGDTETDREGRNTDASDIRDKGEDSDAGKRSKDQDKEEIQESARKEQDKKIEKALQEKAVEKQKELEEEWREFQLWKQDKLYQEATRKHVERKDDFEKKLPRSSKNRDPHKDAKDEEIQTESEDERRPPERYKSLKSSRECSEDRKYRFRDDRRPPESNKSRKSHRDSREEKEYFRDSRDIRPPKCDKSRTSRESRGEDMKTRRNRYSSESSIERSKVRQSKGRSRQKRVSSSESEYDSERDFRKERDASGRRHRRYASSSPDRGRRHHGKSRVESWDLNFSGDSRSIQVEDFLSRIQKLARHEGVSNGELLLNIHKRLKGEAYDWWFTRESHLTSWKRFENEIRFRYGNPNRDRGIRAQIRELKQKKGETFIAFVTEVEKLNQCLQRPFSSRTLFELIWENMRPHYRSRLSVLDIENLEDLIEVNHKIDANDPGFYRPQEGRKELHHLEVDESDSEDSYQEPTIHSLKVNQSDKKKTVLSNSQPIQQPNPVPGLLCWNCRKTGHIWKQCREPKQFFCYMCGNPGRTVRNCEQNHNQMFQRRPTRPTN